MRLTSLIILTLALTSALTVQDAPKPAVVHASQASENRILKAEHDLDVLNARLSSMAMQFQSLQAQAAKLQEDYQKEQPKVAELTKAVDAAITEAYKDVGLTRDTHNFDPANFTFTPKPPDKGASK